jgi:acetyltransferase-like isoleucine patch superfamily enzyme
MHLRALPSFLHRVGMGTTSRMRNLYYRCLGTRILGYVWMRRISIPRQWSDITLERGVALDDGVCLVIGQKPRPAKLVIGSGTYINRYTIFDAHQQLHVGRRVIVGPHCYITDADHGTDPASSVQGLPMRFAPVIIEDEAWIGAHVTVLPGVRVGKGSVVGAGSVVTRDVAPMAIVAGVPARLLRYRDRREITPDTA